MELPEGLAAALERAKQQANINKSQIVSTTQLARADRELLLATGWLQEVMRGWYILVRPDIATGDTAAWYANYWDFLRVYLESRFQHDYCLAAEPSLDLHIDNPIIPMQIVVIAKQGGGTQKLMYDTSLLVYVDEKNFPQEITSKRGIQVMSKPYALSKVSPSYFKSNAREVELALKTLGDKTELSRILVKYQLKAAAARIIGAYNFYKDTDSARVIQNNLKSVGLLVKPVNPFEIKQPLITGHRIQSPYAGRIQAMWNQARDSVIKNFPEAPGVSNDVARVLEKIDSVYVYDAYNSLSIEGYQVSNELIEKVKKQTWNPEQSITDNDAKNAMAAKGYYDTFIQVKDNIKNILSGKKSATVVRENLQLWYQKLFGPSVNVGLVFAQDLIGYRNDRVYIRNSQHSPPPKEAVLDVMEAFFDCLETEPHPGVQAVLGHYFFVYIHPDMDGNGRIARFLMNTFLIVGGYEWTVVRLEKRRQYISILEKTHSDFDLTGFARFIHQEMDGK